jgi:hypothetical protein
MNSMRPSVQAVLFLLLFCPSVSGQANTPGPPKPVQNPSAAPSQSEAPPPLKGANPSGPTPAPGVKATDACAVPEWLARLDDEMRKSIADHLPPKDKASFATNEPLSCRNEKVRYHLKVIGQMLSSGN